MHSPFRHTALLQTTTLDWLHKPRADRWLVASQHTFRWQPVRISVLVWVRSFIEPDILKTMYRLTIGLPIRFQQCPLTCWIFVASFIEVPPL